MQVCINGQYRAGFWTDGGFFVGVSEEEWDSLGERSRSILCSSDRAGLRLVGTEEAVKNIVKEKIL